METITASPFISVLALFVILFFAIRTTDYFYRKMVERSFKKYLKKNYSDLYNLIQEYQVIVRFYKKVNKKGFAILYNRKEWNKILKVYEDEFESITFELFIKKFDSAKRIIDMDSFLSTLMLHKVVKPRSIANFLNNAKKSKTKEIIDFETVGFNDRQKEIIKKNVENKINYLFK